MDTNALQGDNTHIEEGHMGLAKRTLAGLAIVSVLASGFAPSARAEDRSVENRLQNWDSVTLRAPISPDHKWQVFMEAQPRIGNDSTVLVLRPALGYQLTKHFSLWQGYAWQPTFRPEFKNENRIFQQALYETKIRKLSFTNRTRLEERWIEGADGTATRARDQIKFSYPLTRSGRLSVVTSEELFVNLNSVDGGPHGGFDQNRVFAGLNCKLNKISNLEFGYMNQFANRHNARDRMNHILMLTLNFNLL